MMAQKAEILNEVINARIVDILLPDDFKYDWENFCD